MKTDVVKCAASVLVLLALLFNSCFAQNSPNDREAKKIADIKNLVRTQSYVFKAQYANPLSGGNKYLTSEYDFTVSKDSLIAYLPYFGRAFVAPATPEENSMIFTITQFDYKVVEKKYGWDVYIKPKDSRRANSMTLNITSEGYATLQITSNDRDPISYQGYIEAKKPRT